METIAGAQGLDLQLTFSIQIFLIKIFKPS